MVVLPPSQDEGDLDESRGGYEMFRLRAMSARGAEDPTWRVGFDPVFRDGRENSLAQYVMHTLTQYARAPLIEGSCLVDIGCGSGQLTDALTDECLKLGLTHVLVDSPEMLAHLKPSPARVMVKGQFPENLQEVRSAVAGVAFVLAYSVLQYVVRDGSARKFVTAIAGLLPAGGVALIGDVPNRDTRDRQMAASGLTVPRPDRQSEVRDKVLLDLLGSLRRDGFHSFLIPQHPVESMWLHRENLLAIRPAPYPNGHAEVAP